MSGIGRGLALVVLAALPLACDPDEPSDEGQYKLQIGLVDQLGLDSHRVLVGTSFEVELDDADDLTCVGNSASGSLTKVAELQNGGQFTVASAGPGAIELAAPTDACPDLTGALAQFGPDRWSMIGVDASEATGAWVLGDEGAAFNWGTSAGPAGEFPPAFGRPLDELLVVAGGEFSATPVLIDADAGPRAEIRWNADEAVLEVPARYAELTTYTGYDGEPAQRDALVGSLDLNESLTASLAVLDLDIPLPEVRAVPVNRVASLELVPVYWPVAGDEPAREWGPPVGIVAIARDNEGRRILGVPLEWSVTRGRLTLEHGSGIYADSLGLADCKATPTRPRWRGATVEASVGDVVGVAELEWVALPSDETDPSNPDCTGTACTCSTAAHPRDSALAGLGLLLLGGWLRRRQRNRSSAAATAPT